MAPHILWTPAGINYVLVKPVRRIFLWKEDVRQSIADINLTPA